MTPRISAGADASGTEPLPALEPSEVVKWHLLEIVFKQTPLLLSAGVMYISVAGVIWLQSGQNTSVWMGIATTIMLARASLDFAFGRDRGRFDRRTWNRLFSLGSCAMAIVYGLAPLPASAHGEYYVELLALACRAAFIYGTATRVSANPRAANAQIVISSLLIAGTYFSRHDQYSILVSSAVVINIAPTLLIVRQLYRQLLLAQTAQEAMKQLVSEVEHAHRELEIANARLVTMASTDDLTSIANRRRLNDVLDAEWQRAERVRGAFSVYIADIDWFKEYNDSLGHQAGDVCLRRVAQALAKSLNRAGDVAGRYGGEEFVVLLPDTDMAGAREIAERGRAAIEGLGLLHPSSGFGRITVSIGVATLVAQPPATVDDIVRLADEALYRAKQTGRNRVCAAQVELGAESLQTRTT